MFAFLEKTGDFMFNARRFTGTVALPLVLAASLSACGSASRPSAGQLTTAIEHGKAASTMDLPSGLSHKTDACIAKVLVNSKLSDSVLADLAKGKDSTTKSDVPIINGLKPQLVQCAKQQ